MKVARAISARRNYGEGGLVCLDCGDFFRKASPFVRHACFRRMQDRRLHVTIEERLKAIKPLPVVQTLRGEQLPLELN